MEDLNLPIIEGEDIFSKKTLSMNEYLEFVEFNLVHTVDKKSVSKEKSRLTVNVPFIIE